MLEKLGEADYEVKNPDADQYGVFYNSPPLYENQKAVISIVQMGIDALQEYSWMRKGIGSVVANLMDPDAEADFVRADPQSPNYTFVQVPCIYLNLPPSSGKSILSPPLGHFLADNYKAKKPIK